MFQPLSQTFLLNSYFCLLINGIIFFLLSLSLHIRICFWKIGPYSMAEILITQLCLLDNYGLIKPILVITFPIGNDLLQSAMWLTSGQWDVRSRWLGILKKDFLDLKKVHTHLIFFYVCFVSGHCYLCLCYLVLL